MSHPLWPSAASPRASRRRLLAGASAASGAALLAQGARAQSATPTASAAATAGNDDLTSADLGTALARLDRLAREQVEAGAVPGLAIAVVFNDQVVFSRGYGVGDADAATPVTADTVFQIASLSKPVSSSVAAAVIGAGEATWDDKIANRYPDWQLTDPWVTDQVSLRDAFSHRTGVPGLIGAELEAIGFDRDTILHRLRYVPLAGPFRQYYSYSNMMLTAGAEAVVAPLGEAWADVAEARVFGPLGMTNTSYRHADFLSRENRSELHVRIDGAWVPMIKRNPDPQSPAGGVSTSANDLAKWVRLQLAAGLFDGEQVIGAAALQETHIPQIMRGPNPLNGRPSFYALGWNSEVNEDGRIVWRHAGAFSQGARTDVMLVPEANVGILTLANAFPTGLPDALNEMFYDYLFHGEPREDWIAVYGAAYDGIFASFGGDPNRWATAPDPTAPALPNSAYVGTYQSDYNGEAIVEAAGDGLQVRVGPTGEMVWPLTHWDRDTFTYLGNPEPPAPLAAARFTIGDDGQASGLFLESLNDIGLGDFTRVDA